MLSRLPYCILRPEERCVSFSLGGLSLPERLRSSMDARVTGTTVQD